MIKLLVAKVMIYLPAASGLTLFMVGLGRCYLGNASDA